MSERNNTQRNALGSGLIALDLILNDQEKVPSRENVFAGGSCGNVLSILAYLGWNSYPVAQLSETPASNILCQDLARWGVKPDFIDKSAKGVTPLIIHRIYQDKNKHRFEFKNPLTQEWLPRFRPITKKYVASISAEFPHSSVFYFDRASPATLLLAAEVRQQGGIVVFEPSTDKDIKLLEKGLDVCHIVKFSHERLPKYDDSYAKNKALIEIKTMGQEGVSYRILRAGVKWHYLPAFPVESVIDTAGAGDWCTAGIIDQLITYDTKSFEEFSTSDIENAILVGQTYGAINCCFPGARGTMYHLSEKEVRNISSQLIKTGSFPTHSFFISHQHHDAFLRDRSLVAFDELLCH